MDDMLSPLEREFVEAVRLTPAAQITLKAMLKADAEFCASKASKPTTAPREVDLLLGRIDQCNRILKRMEM